MAGIFKAYDIRGIYGKDIDAATVLKIGRAFATFVKCKKVVVGRDMRPHSEPLFQALAEGLTMHGAEVIDIGLCSTPMSYYANGILGADASVMITASHNPGEWNGMKLCRSQGIPISGATGIADIENIVNSGKFDPPAAKKGTVSTYDIMPEYKKHVAKMAHLKRPVKIVADFANSMGIYEAKTLEGILEMDRMFDTLDGTFPNHEANPLDTHTLHAIQERIKHGKYDFGVAFDGDADRAGFIDEKGNVVAMDIITSLIAQDLLATTKGVIGYDLRSSWVVKEIIEANGGTPMMSRVGHAFIKQQMRDKDAIFAGELSGHYYFKDNFYTESSAMATLCVANIISRSDKPLSELIKPIKKYFASGEINSKVADTAKVLDILKKKYSDGRFFQLDGISVEYADWWFNVRSSNTEPLIRLNLEARNLPLMEAKRDELLSVIRA